MSTKMILWSILTERYVSGFPEPDEESRRSIRTELALIKDAEKNDVLFSGGYHVKLTLAAKFHASVLSLSDAVHLAFPPDVVILEFGNQSENAHNQLANPRRSVDRKGLPDLETVSASSETIR